MAQYHIRYKELLWGQSWAFWQRGMHDAPKYESAKTDQNEDNGVIKIDDLESEKKILGLLNNQK